jgi:hypothetical protein
MRPFAPLRAPKTPLAVASAALCVKSIYLGIATAAKIPMITIMITNSINVNPFWFLSISYPPLELFEIYYIFYNNLILCQVFFGDL